MSRSDRITSTDPVVPVGAGAGDLHISFHPSKRARS